MAARSGFCQFPAGLWRRAGVSVAVLVGAVVTKNIEPLTEMKNRISFVDGCKGLAIVLVVYGHVTGGLESGGVLKSGSAFIALRSWLYLFHMPVFFLLSGLVAPRAVGRSLSAFVAGKVRTLVYPYVVWTGIYLVAQLLMARFANNPPDPAKAARFLWEPYGYGLWFLYCLFLISLWFHVLTLTRLSRWPMLAVALALHLAAWINVFSFWPIFNTAMLNFIFFALGAVFHQHLIEAMAKINPVTAVMGGIGLLGLMTVLHWLAGGTALPLILLFALPGIAGLLLLAKGLGPLNGLFSALGLYSLEIYLGHPLFSIAARAASGRVGVHTPALSLCVCVLAGVGGSLLLALACKRWNFPWLFRWPATERKT